MSKLKLIKEEFKKRGFQFENETDKSFDFFDNDCDGIVNVNGNNISYSTVNSLGFDYNTIHWNNGEVVAIVDCILG